MTSFLEQLRAAREAATPGPWAPDVKSDSRELGGGLHHNGAVDSYAAGPANRSQMRAKHDANLSCLLVNNVAKLESLIEAVDAIPREWSLAVNAAHQALADLDRGPTE